MYALVIKWTKIGFDNDTVYEFRTLKELRKHLKDTLIFSSYYIAKIIEEKSVED